MPGPEEEEGLGSPPDDETPDFSRRVLSVDGRVIEFDTPEEAAAALARRDPRGRPIYTGLDTPEEHERRRLRRTYGGRPLAASAAGGARIVTGGLSDVVGGALGFDEDLRGLREANPDADFAGEVVGGVLPLLAFGPLGAAGEAAEGAGALSTLLRAGTAPVRGIAALSEGLGGGAGALLRGTGSTAFRRALGTVGGLAVEGAVEGAGYEATRAISDAALLENPDLSAEAILARLGSGALAGGLAGGALGAGGSLLREIGGGTYRATRDIARSAREAWEASGGRSLPDSFWDTIATISGRPRDAVRRTMAGTDEGRAIRALGLSGGGPDSIERGTVSIVDSLDTLSRSTASARSAWSYGPKRSTMAPLVDSARRAEQGVAARGALASIERMRNRLADPSLFHPSGVRQYVGRMDNWLAGFANDAASGTSVDVFMALDGLKRQLGEVVNDLTNSGENIAVLPELRDMFFGIRSTLEDESLWGRAAGVQREINESVTRALDTSEAFRRRFLAGATARDAGSFLRVPQADSAQIDAFLRRAGTVRNDSSEGIFRAGLEAHERMLRTMADTLDLDPATATELRNGISASERARQRFEESVTQAQMMNIWRSVSHNLGQGGTERAIGGALAGMAVGGPVGAAVGALITTPSIMARGVGLVERFTSGTTSHITDSIRSFLRRSGAVVSDASVHVRQGVLVGAAAYRRRAAQLDEEQRNPRAAANLLSSRLRDLDDMPSVRDGVVAGAARANAYQRRTRPNPRAMAGQIRPQADALPSSAEMAQWLRRVRAVDSPISILDDLRTGRLTPEAVEAVRTVYPELYRQIQVTVLREMVDPDASPTFSQRISLGILLGIPTDPSLSPGHMEVTQGTYAAVAASQPPVSSKAPNIASATASGSESLERRRATA